MCHPPLRAAAVGKDTPALAAAVRVETVAGIHGGTFFSKEKIGRVAEWARGTFAVKAFLP
jgi:hypothetical protein